MIGVENVCSKEVVPNLYFTRVTLTLNPNSQVPEEWIGWVQGVLLRQSPEKFVTTGFKLN